MHRYNFLYHSFNGLIQLNHSLMSLALFNSADWIIADMLAIRQSALGHVRYVLKDGLKWLPLYGWYFSQVRTISKRQKNTAVLSSAASQH